MLACIAGRGAHKVRLGCLPHDPVAVAAAPRHKFGAVMPPAVLDRSLIDLQPGLYDNNTMPDCTAVALANYSRAVAAINGYQLALAAGKPLAFYAQCVGNPPNLAATDGAVMLDVLIRQSTQGFDIGPEKLFGQWGTVQKSRTNLALAMSRFGAAYLGVTLRDRDMQTVGSVWDVATGRDDGPVVGGHAIMSFDYTGLADTDRVRVGTWGLWQPTTWRWLEARLNEAYALVFRQLARADGFYNGVPASGIADFL